MDSLAKKERVRRQKIKRYVVYCNNLIGLIAKFSQTPKLPFTDWALCQGWHSW